MSRGAGNNRCSKREVITIDDDEPTRNHKDANSREQIYNEEDSASLSKRRRKELSPFSEFAELRQKIADLEQKVDKSQQTAVLWERRYKRAVSAAGTHLARVLFLEDLVDKKPDIVDAANMEWENYVDDLKKQLEEERNVRRVADDKMAHLNTQLDEERNKAERANFRLDIMKKQLDVERNVRRINDDELEDEKKARRRAYDREDDMKEELEDEKKERRRAYEKIDQLKRNLAEYETPKCEYQTMAEAVEAKPVILPPTTIGEGEYVYLDKIAHTHNMLKLLSPTAKNAISIDEAVMKVRAAFEKCGEEARKNYEKNVVLYNCEACGANTPNKLVVTKHFLSEEHIEKVRAHKGSVSKFAVDNWVDVLVHFESVVQRKSGK